MGSSESKSESVQSAPQPAAPVPKPELDKPWRNFKWDQKDALKKRLEEFTPSNPDVKDIKILVAGQIGAGKSSFINSVNSVFQQEIRNNALVDAAGGSKSCTKHLKGYHIKSSDKPLPYIFRDIMGLESENLTGSQPDDIVNAVFGHVMDGYKFDEVNLLTGGQHYRSNPDLKDKAFCLVYVIAADTVTFTDDKVIDKLKIIRHKISAEGIPQVIVMTKIDAACPLVKNDLRKLYTSKKIKEKMEMCRDKIGVPMCNIFPVKNYHEEIETENDVDVLILKALDQIVREANDHLIDH